MRKTMLITAGILIIFFAAGFVMFQVNTTPTHPLATGRIVPGVYAVAGQIVDVFLLRDGDDYLAIDAGDNPAPISAGLHRLRVDPRKVTVLLLTHSDYDHVAGLNLFPRAAVYLGTREEAMLDGKVARMFGLVRNQKLNRPYRLLDDGQVLKIGNFQVKAIATPGHTYGSTSYLINNQYLFTGDTIALQEGKAKLFHWFNYSDSLEARSIAKLAGLHDIKLMCTAHTGDTKDFTEALRAWRKK